MINSQPFMLNEKQNFIIIFVQIDNPAKGVGVPVHSFQNPRPCEEQTNFITVSNGE